MAENQSQFLPMSVQEFDPKKVIEQWTQAYEQQSLLNALRAYWRDFVPMVCRPSLATETKNDESRDRKIAKYLFGPLEQFLCGGEPSVVFAKLKEQDKPQQICGHVFKSGEPTYSCRDCGMDPTCVLCITCFESSCHRTHRYRMSTSGGGGYCDCGDVEAWKSEPFCDKHQVKKDDDEMPVDMIALLPSDLRERARTIFNCLLRHALELLEWEADDKKLPEGMHVEELNDDFVTMLFNDEVHTYEQVISALKRAVQCSYKQAVEFATTVDREGRSCVHVGKYTDCDKAKGVIEKNTSRLGSKPLKVQVLHSSVVSQQMFAVKILQWLQTVISKSDGLRELFCQVSMEPQDNQVSLLQEILRMDTSLWKAARVICHQTIMAAVLLSPEYKCKFAILFTQMYHVISADYIKDDHDHAVCVVSESVQLFTVPSLARMLIRDYNLLTTILDSFLSVCETKKKQNGKFAFERGERIQNFRRAQYMLHDLKYALSVPPEPHEWNDDLRRNFCSGFGVLLKLLTCMQGMDAVTRQTGQHIEFEPEWESAFNLQLRLDDTLTLFLEWCQTDRQVLIHAYAATLDKIYECRDIKYKRETEKWLKHEAKVIKYDVSSQPISIHLPLSRLLAGLHLHLAKFDLSFFHPDIPIKHKDLDCVDLIEHPLRVEVMIAQTHAGMWRRNGFSLLNQIYFYSNVKCRREMFDRDIVMIQAGAALIPPNEFLIHLMNKYGLLSFFKDDSDSPSSKSKNTPEDLIRQVIGMAEEFLNLLIILLSERYDPAIGQIEANASIKREIVHQLCISSMAHSELSKAVPHDFNEETNLELVIDEVATTKELGGSGKKIFELRPEFYKDYNPYFYHYHRSDQTKSEEEQRKRKKNAGEDQALPPPFPPSFQPAFQAITNLLSCDIMVHIMKVVLSQTSAQRSRKWSEAQFERVLHLIGLALYEEKRRGKRGDFPFIKKACHGKESIQVLLANLVGHKNVSHDSHRDLLKWVNALFNEVLKMKDSTPDAQEKVTSPDTSANDEKAAKERERKAKLAEKRRKQCMEMMAKIQQDFIQVNADWFESTDSDLHKNTGENEMEVTHPPDVFPVCVGPEQNHIPQSTPATHTCILCQEQETITLHGSAMVLATYSQRSTVLCRNRGQTGGDKVPVSSEALFMMNDLQCGTFTSTCGHVMHASCWQRFFDSVVTQERRRMFRFRHYPSFDIEKMEFLCPLCETISNSVMPIIPPLLTPGTRDSAGNSAMTMNEWMGELQKSIEASVKEHAREFEEEMDTFSASSVEANIASILLRSMSSDVMPSVQSTKLSETVYDPESSSTSSDTSSATYSDSITQMVRKMARDVFSVNVMTPPDEENHMTPIFVWQTCAYSIQVLEQCLKDENKALFGALSSRQSDCLSTLVKVAAVVGQLLHPQHVRGYSMQLLVSLLPTADSTTDEPSILKLDLFHHLVSLSVSLPLLFATQGTGSATSVLSVTTGGVNDLFLLKLMVLARIVQIIANSGSSDENVQTPDNSSMETDEIEDDETRLLYTFYLDVRSYLNMETPILPPALLKEKIREELTSFLRCAALYYHFLTGITPPEALFTPEDFDQSGILGRYLGLGTNLYSNLLSDSEIVIQQIVKAWCQQHEPDSEETSKRVPQLIELQSDYSRLINSLSSFTCPNSDGEDSRAPTMCLVCGALLCSHSYCCQMDLDGQQVGAATFHAHHCGAGIGMLLRVRECQILLLAGRTKGCFLPAPYLDRYGETDQLLRRGNPLHLSLEKYKKLQKLWLSHGIPEEIAHQLESNTNLMTYEWQNL